MRTARSKGRAESAGEAPDGVGEFADVADGGGEFPAAARNPSTAPARKQGSPSSFRMRLGAAGEEEARAYRQDEARRRLRRLRPWISALFLASALSLLLYLASLVLTVAGASEAAVAIVIVSLLCGGVVTWVLGVVSALRLREWRWLAVTGLVPVVATLAVLLVPLSPALAYPLVPIAGLVYALSKRGELFA